MSIANLTPYHFWKLWENGLIDRKVLKHKKVKFKLKMPYQELSSNLNLKEIPCLFHDGVINHKETLGKVTKLDVFEKQLVAVPC